MALGRADPHRLGRLPGLLAARHPARRRRRRRHLPQRLRRRRDAFHAGARRGGSSANLGSDIAMCLDHVPPPGVERRELEDAVRRTTEWARRQRHAERADGPAPLRDQPGRHRPRAAPALGRGAARARLRRQRDRRARDRRGPRRRCSRRPTGSTALLPGGQAPLLHGHRRPGGDPRGDRGRGRHVRLRPPDPHRAYRQRAHVGGPAQPPQRALRPRRRAARRGLRLPGLHAVHAGLHPPPREPERAPRTAPALAPQSTLPARADRPRPRGDRAGRVRLLQTQRPGASRPNDHPSSSSSCSSRFAWFLLVAAREAAPALNTRRCRTSSRSATRSSPPEGSTATVREVDDDQLRIEIAPGVLVTLDRRAVAAVAERRAGRGRSPADPRRRNGPIAR